MCCPRSAQSPEAQITIDKKTNDIRNVAILVLNFAQNGRYKVYAKKIKIYGVSYFIYNLLKLASENC